MATSNSSFLRKMLPTGHRLLLDREMKSRYASFTGSGLVVGAGLDNYRRLLFNADAVTCTDIEPVDGVQFADAHDLPFNSESFDFVMAIEVFEHLHTPRKAAEELYRVLKPGSRALITVPFMFRIHADPNDYHRFSDNGLRQLLSRFSTVEVMPFGNRIHVISDLITTLSRGAVPLRLLNHLWCLPPISSASIDSPSGYVVELSR